MDVDGLHFEPTLKGLLERRSLKWIFVGGKGGVGKTTTSCCLAIQLSKVRKNVLIISTDPAHNLGDAFCQKFTKDPTLVNGFTNLYAMEVDPTIEAEEEILGGQQNKLMHELALSLPGIDEAMSFAEVMKLVQSMEFETIVFDTAPTGHTLRLLSFPATLEKSLGKFVGLKSKFSTIFTQLSSFMGIGENEEQMAGKLESTKQIIEDVNTQFKNPELTTFVCVCIPEFLSLYETERLIQELNKFQIDCENIVVNQVLYPEKDGNCKLCAARQKMQQKYIEQINDLYDLFHIVKMPLLPNEVRGADSLNAFSIWLLQQFTQN